MAAAVAQAEMSPQGALYRSFPFAFFLLETVMHRAHPEWNAVLEQVQVEDANRLSNLIRVEVERADRRLAAALATHYQSRFSPYDEFRFSAYREVKAFPEPQLFVCKRCGQTRDLAPALQKGWIHRNELQCESCHTSLKQLVHVFTHARCGTVKFIRRESCPTCHEPLLLRLDNRSFGRSRWVCPNKHSLLRTTGNGPTRRLVDNSAIFKICPECRALGDDVARMSLQPAQQAVKVVSRSVIDLRGDANWEEVARDRFGVQEESLEQLVLERYGGGNPLIRNMLIEQMAKDEARRKQLFAELVAEDPSLEERATAVIRAVGAEPIPEIQSSLAEYSGASKQAAKSPDPVDKGLRAIILQAFHLNPRYVDNLRIQRMVYGYRIGSSSADQARINLFDDRTTKHVLTSPITTEAALFDLDAIRLVAWLNVRHAAGLDELELHRRLLTVSDAPQSQDPIYRDVETLLHTLAHLLVRQSEIFTGLSRDSFAELVFPPALGFLIYCQDGSEVGALRTTFSSYRLRDWLYAARNAARTCANDPTCARGEISGSASCHVCLHVAERNCNEYWNQTLDRRLVANEGGTGFLDASTS